MNPQNNTYLVLFMTGLVLSLFCCAAFGESAVLKTAGCPSLFDQASVAVVFSKNLDSTEAVKISNYRVSGASTVQVNAVQLQAGYPNSVILRLSDSMVTGTTARVWVDGGKDADGEVIAPQSFSFNVCDVDVAAQRIQSCALPNGAINVYAPTGGVWKPSAGVRIVPYFSCEAALGLISAWRMTGNSSYLKTVLDYLDWHDQHFNPDGTVYDYTGTVSSIVSTNDYDSSDSYGAMYLCLLWRYYIATGDVSIFRERMPKIDLAVNAMYLTMQSDSLTWAKPDYHIKYTMDNAEVFQGFFAAAQLAHVLGDDVKYIKWLAQAHATRNAIQSLLWDSNHYKVNLGQTVSGPAYYPDGMANDMAAVFVDAAGGSRVQTSWQWSRQLYMPNGVPAVDMSLWAPWAALRAGDKPGHNIAMARSIELTYSQWFNAPDAGVLLQIGEETRPIAVLSHTAETVTLDGLLNDDVWSQTGHLWFHPLGLTVRADNRQAYMQPANTLDPDGSVLIGFANDNRKLYVGIQARDRYLTSAGDAIDSDGLSPLNIRDAVNPELFHQVGLTFSGTKGGCPVTSPTAQGVLAQLPESTRAWSFLSGNNTINNNSDLDSGYCMELELDLAKPELGGYVGTNPLDVKFGLRFADMDGVPFQPWPWTNGAEGTMFQLAEGLFVSEYSINTVRLIQGKRPQAGVPFDLEQMTKEKGYAAPIF